MKSYFSRCVFVLLVLMQYSNYFVESAECSGDTCENCLASGPSCGWCADSNFDELRFPRCQNFQGNQTVGSCPRKSVIQPVSRILKSRKHTNSQPRIFDEKKIISTIRQGQQLQIPLTGQIPTSINKRKSAMKIRVLGSAKQQIDYKISSDCKKLDQKKADTLICKGISKGDLVNVTLTLTSQSCLGPKHRTKLTIRVRNGNVKQTIHLLVRDTCKCTCKARKQKRGRSRCVYNGKMAVGNCQCSTKPPTTPSPPRRIGAGEHLRETGESNYPQPSNLVGCETCDVRDHCADYGQCVDCLAFFNSPMPRRMCSSFCSRGFPLVSKVLGLSGGCPKCPKCSELSQYSPRDDLDEQAVCSFNDHNNCIMRFREIEDGIIEVGALKECPAEKSKCSNASCKSENGLVCNGHGTCLCGQCQCDPDSGYTGSTCSTCTACQNTCDVLKPCIQCMELNDFSKQYKTEGECQANCQGYQGRIQTVNFFRKTPQKNCMFRDLANCRVTYGFSTDSNGDIDIQVLRQRVCPEGGWIIS